ncbi:MAG: FxDxF family PEP-CTERM protein [Methylophilus sp.]|uniref:FxDxF family PEP-CTERM protein n=1 Tax=Methylophilus sp. TaxID=29541 RepID=UPI003F9FD1B1
MKKLKNLALCLFFSVFAASANAEAIDFNYGVVNLDVNPSVGSFEHFYTFELFGLSRIDYSISKIFKDFSLGENQEAIVIYDFQDDLAGFNFGLYDEDGALVTDSSSLSAGEYTFKIAGIATGLYGGHYNFTANAISLPVPEPEMSVLFLLGLSMIGWVSLRRSHYS